VIQGIQEEWRGVEEALGWMMKLKIGEVKEGGAGEGEGSDCELWHPCCTSFMKRLRCAQCRWGVIMRL